MKYVKPVLAGLLVIVTASQYFIYGFLDLMILWLLYSLLYLAAGIYQKFHRSSLWSQIFTLLYISVPLIALIVYSVKAGWPQLTQTFYIVFMIALALACIWEVISLCLAVKEKSEGKKPKQ